MIEFSKFEQLPLEEQQKYLMETLASLSEEEAKELWESMMKLDDFKDAADQLNLHPEN